MKAGAPIPLGRTAQPLFNPPSPLNVDSNANHVKQSQMLYCPNDTSRHFTYVWLPLQNLFRVKRLRCRLEWGKCLNCPFNTATDYVQGVSYMLYIRTIHNTILVSLRPSKSSTPPANFSQFKHSVGE